MPSNATNQNIKIVSDNPDVVEVISDNTLKALNIGTTYVYATTQDGGFTEKAKITVEDAEEWIKANIPNKISFMLNGNLTNNNGIVSYNGEIMIRNKAPKHIVINNVTLYQTISYSDLSIIGQYNLAIECFGDKSLGAYNFNNIYEPYISFDFTYEGVNLSITKRFLDISNQ
ncbi:MAG: Ig-like domain-containing protein [Muribaculaceae bacterium]|nr:Ig-like domain-containing protein [Muribaculaceae bacterium]